MSQTLPQFEGTDSNGPLAEEVFRAHRSALVAYLGRRLDGDGQTANDVAQEAFARIVAAKRRYAPAEARGLLYRIARNLLVDHHRTQRSRRRAEVALAQSQAGDHVPPHDRQLAAREELALIEQAILALPPRCQQVYVLHRFEGLTYGAIAARCGITPSVVEKHMRKALGRIADAIDPEPRR